MRGRFRRQQERGHEPLHPEHRPGPHDAAAARHHQPQSPPDVGLGVGRSARHVRRASPVGQVAFDAGSGAPGQGRDQARGAGGRRGRPGRRGEENLAHLQILRRRGRVRGRWTGLRRRRDDFAAEDQGAGAREGQGALPCADAGPAGGLGHGHGPRSDRVRLLQADEERGEDHEARGPWQGRNGRAREERLCRAQPHHLPADPHQRAPARVVCGLHRWPRHAPPILLPHL
mmetsp:Transcript_1660/g.7249  ORF Transcript_1660/g.7249 Transcript_1660/m.7249 type:complete len:230 (+) Transcript_1660:682-1371(+)